MPRRSPTGSPAMLPCFMADGLRRRSEPHHRADVWVLVHPDLRDNPRVRLFRVAIIQALAAHGASA